MLNAIKNRFITNHMPVNCWNHILFVYIYLTYFPDSNSNHIYVLLFSLYYCFFIPSILTLIYKLIIIISIYILKQSIHLVFFCLSVNSFSLFVFMCMNTQKRKKISKKYSSNLTPCRILLLINFLFQIEKWDKPY